METVSLDLMNMSPSASAEKCPKGGLAPPAWDGTQVPLLIDHMTPKK